MSELTPLAKSFLEAHLGEGNPSRKDRSRVRAAVAVAMVAPAVAEAASVGAAKALASSGALSSAVAKSALVGTILVVAVGGVVTWQALANSRGEPAVILPRTAMVPVTPEPKAEIPPASPTVEQSPVIEAPPKLRQQAGPASKAIVKTPETDPLLAREVQLVAMAQRALREQNPELALQLLDFRDQELGSSGRLEEEAMAATVWALCGAKRLDEAQAAHSALKSRFPASLHLERTKNACW
jgi:hypothetical protein